MRRLLWMVGTALLAGCAAAEGTHTTETSGAEALVIRAGTSFGMCLGYCETEMRVDRREIVLTQRSREPERNPTRTVRVAITPREWAELVALAEPRAFSGLQEVYGCPDCADGGAEWVELVVDGQTRRVTFEHGAEVDRIQPLVARLREIRERLLADA